ncbi:MAG: TrkH family potassium uptake protein [Xanthomonadaceae bacterium]|jgi:trk system potassium uptake protein TrkH|nr:TrkH family potassium uptake protein [Xanthomonadaceae bacterium]
MPRFSERTRTLQRLLGAIVAFSGLIALPPALLALWWGEPTALAFFQSALLPVAAGLLLWYPVRRARYELRLRDGFLVVSATWIIACVVTALPFMLAPPHLGFSDAVFEATSGLTTTGATMITGLEQLPRSVLFYRASLNYLGGMGIVILAVAILPMLRIGGMQLFRAESTGPQKDSKLTPRIADTAKALWAVYTVLVLVCAVAFWAAGMDLFDAISHAMTTVSTAGFANYDASFGHWDNPLIDGLAITFMLLGGLNFGLHWYAWRRATLGHYRADAEARLFLRIIVAATVVVTLAVWLGGRFEDPLLALRHALFQVVSNLTTSGFTTTGFADWPGLAPLLLVMLAFVGGCAGSTSGGMKVARVQMVVRQGFRELKQLVHPKGQFLVKVGGKRVSESVVIAVAGFCALYLLAFVAMTLLLVADGVDLVTAFSAVAACINNLGPGLGAVASNYQELGLFSTWVCSFAMVLGRLEVFTLLVLLTPQFWRD